MFFGFMRENDYDESLVPMSMYDAMCAAHMALILDLQAQMAATIAAISSKKYLIDTLPNITVGQSSLVALQLTGVQVFDRACTGIRTGDTLIIQPVGGSWGTNRALASQSVLSNDNVRVGVQTPQLAIGASWSETLRVLAFR